MTPAHAIPTGDRIIEPMITFVVVRSIPATFLAMPSAKNLALRTDAITVTLPLRKACVHRAASILADKIVMKQ
jgi:hypothetical protein